MVLRRFLFWINCEGLSNTAFVFWFFKQSTKEIAHFLCSVPLFVGIIRVVSVTVLLVYLAEQMTLTLLSCALRTEWFKSGHESRTDMTLGKAERGFWMFVSRGTASCILFHDLMFIFVTYKLYQFIFTLKFPSMKFIKILAQSSH